MLKQEWKWKVALFLRWFARLSIIFLDRSKLNIVKLLISSKVSVFVRPSSGSPLRDVRRRLNTTAYFLTVENGWEGYLKSQMQKSVYPTKINPLVNCAISPLWRTEKLFSCPRKLGQHLVMTTFPINQQQTEDYVIFFSAGFNSP